MRYLNSLSDKQILTALDLADNEGMFAKDIGDRLGCSKNTIIGAMDRARKAADKHFPPCSADGTLPRQWWKK